MNWEKYNQIKYFTGDILCSSILFFLDCFSSPLFVGVVYVAKIGRPSICQIFLFAMSLWFYGYYNIRYLWVLVGSLFFNFLFSIILEKIRAKRLRQGLFLIGLFGNIGLLFYFKYFGFFLDNCNYFLHTNIQIEKIALPLGISFFTFQQISFLADRYSEKAPHYSFLDYACFITYFPQLIAGPIVLHSELVPQLLDRRNRKPDVEMFFDGFTLFILGLSKKVLLAKVAHDLNPFFDHLYLHTSRWQSEGSIAAMPQYYARVSDQWSLAWSQLDLHHMGAPSRNCYGMGNLLSPTALSIETIEQACNVSVRHIDLLHLSK